MIRTAAIPDIGYQNRQGFAFQQVFPAPVWLRTGMKEGRGNVQPDSLSSRLMVASRRAGVDPYAK
jgi:hypothetical protein